MKQSVIVLALLLCLGLSACGGAPGGEDASAGEERKAAEDTVLLTVNGRDVPAWKYLYWLTYAGRQITDRYAQAGMEPDWEAPADGGTLADHVKEQALANTVLYAVVEELAVEQGYVSAGAAEARMPDMGFDAAQMEQLEEVGRMYAWLYERVCAGETALAPSEEALKVYADSCGAVTLDRILIPLGEDREGAQQRAAEVFSLLNGAENPGTEFAALASESADTRGPRTVWPEDGQLDAQLLAAAQELHEGQLSGILESPEGFSILLRLETDRSALMEFWLDDRLQQAAQQAQVRCGEAYDEIDAAALCTEGGSIETPSEQEEKRRG